MAEENRFVPVKDVLDILFAEFHSFWEVPCSNYDRAIQRRVCAVRDKINKLEFVDPPVGPAGTGEWVCVPASEGLPRYQCSRCGLLVDAGDDRNYCSHCGARMLNVHDKIQLPAMAVDAEQYNELREAFVDYVCSGVPNLAPYCKNRCAACVDGRGWCRESFCKGFYP